MNKRKNSQSIKDIAKLAGVSHTTVSRVINNSGPVKPETRAHIMQIIQEQNFMPNAAAKALIQGKTFCIGLAMNDTFFSADFTLPFIQGMTPVLNDAGYSYILMSNAMEGKTGSSLFGTLNANKIDGLFLFNIETIENENKTIKKLQIPKIYISSKPASADCNYVISDDFNGACKAVQHLIDKGHRKIGYINGTPSFATSIERRRGFLATIEQNDLPLLSCFECCGYFEIDKGYKAMQELMDRNPYMTAVFAASDLMAFGAYKAVKERGMRIPDDIAIVGFDNREFCSFMEPALTTVEKPKWLMGKLAAEMMLGVIEKKPDLPRGLVVPTELIVRDST